jgi:quinol monooxygenase YgiN
MGCAIHEEDNNQRSIIYMEQWESKEALQQHIQSNIYLMILNAMELAAEVPEIHFYNVLETMGLEFIAALRSNEKPNRGLSL